MYRARGFVALCSGPEGQRVRPCGRGFGGREGHAERVLVFAVMVAGAVVAPPVPIVDMGGDAGRQAFDLEIDVRSRSRSTVDRDPEIRLACLGYRWRRKLRLAPRGVNRSRITASRCSGVSLVQTSQADESVKDAP